MQYAIVILDGASGDSVAEFDGKTSLEHSRTPHLDSLAAQGMVGLMQNVPSHMESSSNVACMSIVGYDPAKYPIGRGAIEGASIGIDLKPGQVACRLNLCYVEDGIMTGYSTDNIATEDGHALAHELKEALDDDTFELYLGTSFRQALVVTGYPELMDLAYETPHDNTGLPIAEVFAPKVCTPPEQVAKRSEGDEAVASCEPPANAQVSDVPAAATSAARAQAAANALVDYIHRANDILAKSPVNARRIAEGKWPANHIWIFWPGEKPGSLQSFSDVYGKSAAMNSAVDLLDGIAVLTDMKVYNFDGVTDGPNNDFAAQGAGALHMLEEGNEVVTIHVEAPDAAGHDGRPDEKQAGIELSDLHILRPLVEYAKTHPLRIAVMPDHPTPLATRKHSCDPVPFVVAGPGIVHNGCTRMTEQQARDSGILIDPGYTFMKDILLAE